MSLVTFALASLVGVVKVWTEPSLANVYPDTLAPTRGEPSIRLYAARGEWESFQLCVRAGRRPIESLTIRSDRIGKAIGPPDVYLVGWLAIEAPSARAYAAHPLRPDVLRPLGPEEKITIAPERTAVFWVTCHVPSEAAAGVHRGRVRVAPAKGRTRDVDVTVEVFDFELPAVPTLRSLAFLDRAAIGALYGLEEGPPEPWQPVYEVLAPSRLSFSLWDDNLVRLNRLGKVDTTAFKSHLDQAVGVLGMSTINLAHSRTGIGPFPKPADPLASDVLERYLHDMADWLEGRGWLDRALVFPAALPPRVQWQEARETYFRVWRADSRVKRLLAGAVHPYFERYTDIWAVPLREYHPVACGRLQAGMSLAAAPPFPPERVEASSSGGGLYSTAPEDACDGCLFTAWQSREAPTAARPQWVEVYFETPVRTDQLRIGWLPGHEPEDIRVRTSHDGEFFGSASVEWQHVAPLRSYDQSWSEGRFKLVKTFLAVRLEFRGTRSGGPVGITEIEFGRAPDPGTIRPIEPIELWLYPLREDFPSLAADAHPGEARLLPWVCWGHDFKGFVVGSVNEWPAAWHGFVEEPPSVWTGCRASEKVLFYPGRVAPLPSIRAERLRDGIEDYEYLVAMQKTIEEGITVRLPARRKYAHDVPGEMLDGLVQQALEARVAIGRELTRTRRSRPQGGSRGMLQ